MKDYYCLTYNLNYWNQIVFIISKIIYVLTGEMQVHRHFTLNLITVFYILERMRNFAFYIIYESDLFIIPENIYLLLELDEKWIVFTPLQNEMQNDMLRINRKP